MSNNIIAANVWIIGAGYMAKEYAKVLTGLNVAFTVIGNSQAGSAKFEQDTGIKAVSGGLDNWLQNTNEVPTAVINATSAVELYSTTKSLLEYGIKNLLLEKPAGINQQQVDSLTQLATDQNSKVYVAYNRRFYSSVVEAQKIIEQDGGVSSFNFEFTEWSHRISQKVMPKEMAHSWFLCNSSHVVDMAFFMGGWPRQLSSFVTGSLDWHPAGSTFAGAGISEHNALFSYQANWAAPGRWRVEILTTKSRLIFSPLEKLQIQLLGSIKVDDVTVDDQLDQSFKPGLYLQTQAFLNGDKTSLLSIEAHKQHVEQVYEKMLTSQTAI